MRDKNTSARSGAWRYILLVAAAVAVLGLLIFFVLRGSDDPPSSNESGTIMHYDPVHNFTFDFSHVGWLPDIPEITELASEYLEAMRTGDADTLNRIMQTENTIEPGQIQATGGYIEGYRNVTAHCLAGMDGNSYVAYITFDEKITGIATAAPSMRRLYVVYSSSEGAYRILNGPYSEELKAFLSNADTIEDVIILTTEVNRAFQQALVEDSELAGLFERLQRQATATQPTETTPEPTQPPATQPSSETEEESGSEEETDTEDATGTEDETETETGTETEDETGTEDETETETETESESESESETETESETESASESRTESRSSEEESSSPAAQN